MRQVLLKLDDISIGYVLIIRTSLF